MVEEGLLEVTLNVFKALCKWQRGVIIRPKCSRKMGMKWLCFPRVETADVRVAEVFQIEGFSFNMFWRQGKSHSQ